MATFEITFKFFLNGKPFKTRAVGTTAARARYRAFKESLPCDTFFNWISFVKSTRLVASDDHVIRCPTMFDVTQSWDYLVPIGTEVNVKTDEGDIKTVTTSRAVRVGGLEPAVFVKGLEGPWSIGSNVKVV